MIWALCFIFLSIAVYLWAWLWSTSRSGPHGVSRPSAVEGADARRVSAEDATASAEPATLWDRHA